MKSKKNWLNSREADAITFGFVLGCMVSMIVAAVGMGCASTVRPVVNYSAEASWDGNVQNSGFIAFDAVGNGIITPHGRDRYNALMARYGYAKTNDGITSTNTNTFLIDAQHLAYFARAERRLKNGK